MDELVLPCYGLKLPSACFSLQGVELSPTNQLSSLLSLLPNELRNKFSNGSKSLFGENLTDEIVKRLGAVLSPPRSNIDAQLPLTRNNLDFIVHNANTAAIMPPTL